MENDFSVAGLIAVYLAGKLTPAEKSKLDEWVGSSVENRKIFQRICDEENWKRWCGEVSLFDMKVARKELQRRLYHEKRRFLYRKIYRYAAAVFIPLLIAAGAFYVYENRIGRENTRGDVQASVNNQPAILPGTRKAVLKLSDGIVVNLNKENGVNIREYDGTDIQVKNNVLCYNATYTGKRKLHNSLIVPHGGEYSVRLSDGTVVHLNSMTKLKFPSVFDKDKRVVELEGEAYFDVTKSKVPFIIKASGVEIKVLGTSFNVYAYKGEPVRATLVRGSIRISTSTDKMLLKPSQQAVVDMDEKKIEVQKVDAQTSTSWNVGRLYFKDEKLEDIMQVLARWYDIKVVYNDEAVRNIRFGCYVDRYKEISPFLKILEETGKVHVVQKGNQIELYSF